MVKKIVLKIKDMHCTSCAINIDGELEDVKGVIEAKTSYARQQVEVVYDPEKIDIKKIIEIIKNTGYRAVVSR